MIGRPIIVHLADRIVLAGAVTGTETADLGTGEQAVRQALRRPPAAARHDLARRTGRRSPETLAYRRSGEEKP
jgi:hypothetical protein